MSIIDQLNVAANVTKVIKEMRQHLETSAQMTQQAIDAAKEAAGMAKSAVDTMRQASDLLADGKHDEAHQLLEIALGIRHEIRH